MSEALSCAARSRPERRSDFIHDRQGRRAGIRAGGDRASNDQEIRSLGDCGAGCVDAFLIARRSAPRANSGGNDQAVRADDPAYRGLHTWDFGLEEITGNRADRFKQRTPPLRGVALSSPYMHNGAYSSLEDAIQHHENPRHAYATYDISQIEAAMQAEDSAGRKLDFLTQEMLREINTIGSKAGDVEITRHVIEIKTAIERLKEMIQNVE